MTRSDFASPRWRRWLLNRFVLVPALLTLVTIVWNLWVVTHDHGLVAGRVIDTSGAPVDGAEVKLWVFNFATFVVKDQTTTAQDGSFAFKGNPSHNIQVSAEKPGRGRTPRVPIRLYFASQDYILPDPLLTDGN